MDTFYQVLDGHKSDVNWLDFSGKNKLASCSNDCQILLWNVESEDGDLFTTNKLSPLKGHKYGVNCVRFSPFGTIMASASTDGYIILWNSHVS